MVSLRLGPYRSWLVFHPDQIEEVLTRKSASFIRFAKLIKVLRQWNGDSLLMAEGQAWRDRRRRVLPAFQTRRLPDYGMTAVNETDALLLRFSQSALPDGSVQLDLDKTMAGLTLNVALRTLFGARPRMADAGIEEALGILSEVAFAESTAPLVLPHWLPFRQKKAKRRAMQVMNDLVSGLVNARLRDGASDDRKDLLSILIEEHEGDFTAIRDDSMSLLIAGHETSGALLTWIFACLARHPNWLTKLQGELTTILNGRAPELADLRSMPVLRAVVDESLRLYPPAYSLFLRQAIRPVEIGGARLRTGDLVQIIPYTTHRDQRFFTNPEAFAPERFLSDPTWPPYAYLPFGAGPRVCIGQNFGLMEVCLITARLLQHVRPQPLAEIPQPRPRFSLRPNTSLHMRWRLL